MTRLTHAEIYQGHQREHMEIELAHDLPLLGFIDSLEGDMGAVSVLDFSRSSGEVLVLCVVLCIHIALLFDWNEQEFDDRNKGRGDLCGILYHARRA